MLIQELQEKERNMEAVVNALGAYINAQKQIIREA